MTGIFPDLYLAKTCKFANTFCCCHNNNNSQVGWNTLCLRSSFKLNYNFRKLFSCTLYIWRPESKQKLKTIVKYLEHAGYNIVKNFTYLLTYILLWVFETQSLTQRFWHLWILRRCLQKLLLHVENKMFC